MIGPPTTRVSLLDRLGSRSPPEAAWEDFVRTYGPAVHRWCRGHGLQAADAADVAQDVLVRFWRQTARFRYRPGSRFRGYLRAIVRGAVADWHAARSRSPAAGDSPFDILALESARDDLAARIEEAFDTELFAMAMTRVRKRVQPHTWRAFERQVFEDCSATEVAAELGVEVNVVYVARHKVTRMLRETVQRLEADGHAG